METAQDPIEVESDKNYIPLTEEELKDCKPDAALKEKRERARQERIADERAEERHVYFNIAEKWAEKSGLTPAEAAHGVAHDLYAEFGHTGEHVVVNEFSVKDILGGPELAADYGRLYDNIKASNIQAKSMRAAADLFD